MRKLPIIVCFIALYILLQHSDSALGDASVTLKSGMLNRADAISSLVSEENPEYSSMAMPGGVSNAILWLAPNCDVSYDGSNLIDSWDDISSGGYVLSNEGVSSLVGSMPTYVDGSFVDDESSSNPTFNFNPSISFNKTGSGDYLGFENFSTFSDASGFTVFAVVNFPLASSSDQTIFSYLASDSFDDEFDLGISDDSGTDGVLTESADSNAELDGDLRDGITRIIAVEFDGSGSAISINGGTPGGDTFPLVSVANNGTFVIGQDLDDFSTPAFDGGRSLKAEVGDLIIFDQVVTATNQQKVTSYLALKYGITMDQTTQQDYLNSGGSPIFPVVAESGNYASYSNDIAGIGRDDASGLSQLRSKSVNTDGILTGMVENFDSDLQFVLWGNDDGGLIFNTTEISGAINTRLAREWRIAVSNSAGPVDITFDLSGTTNTPTTSDNIVLIIDDDGDFSNGFLRSSSASTWDGSTATFDNISLNDDEVLTISSMPNAPGGVSPNLGLWLNAEVDAFNTGSTTATDGQLVESWGDQSGNGNDAANLLVTQQPILNAASINFRAALDFDGADDLSGLGGFSTVDYFVVFEPNLDFTSSSSPATILGFGAVFDGLTLGDFFADDDVVSHFTNSAYSRYVDDASLTISGPTLINARNNSAGTEQNLLINENQRDNTTFGAFANFTGGFIIGNNPGETSSFEGQIAEIISYDTRLSDAERLKVSSYLGIKYGLFLEGSSTHYVATDGDFVYEKVVAGDIDNNHDIAAIGRDDITNLDQQKSKSVNSDARVTIALTDDGGTFQNPNSFSENLSFLAWGNDDDDNGVVEDGVSDLPSNVASRLDRQWRVQEKGMVGQVTLEVDLSGIDPVGVETDFTTRTAADFLLLINSGATFSSGLTKSLQATSFDAVNEIATFEADFEDGDFFTIATSKIASFGPGGVSSNLQLWLKANDGIDESDGQLVDQWDDQSGNGFHATQANGGMQGVFLDASNSQAINFHPAVEFDNDLDNYNINSDLSVGSTGDVTSYYVARADLEVGNDILLALGSATNAQVHNLRVVGSPTLSYIRLPSNQIVGATTLNNDQVLLASFQRLASNSFQLKLNGLVDTTGAIGDGTFFANSTTTLGALDNTGNSGFAGELAEVIIYNDNHSTTAAAAVESYLALKYGITLNGGDYDYTSPEGSIFYPGSSDPDFAAYRTDVAGICRDDKSDWEQLSSASVNSTASLSMTKSESFSGNDQYITWAHNGSEISATASDFPSGIEARLDRTWKVKKTNSPSGIVSMTFKLVSNYEASDLRILVDNDGDFSDAATLSTVPSVSGDEFTFSSIDLSNLEDGDLFSIGTVSRASSPLPLTWLFFSARQSVGGVLLGWETTNEINVRNFEVERSRDGVNFIQVGSKDAYNVADQFNSYQYVDDNPLPGISYYRVRQVDYDGSFTYSALQLVDVDLPNPIISTFPNPATDELNIQFNRTVLTGKFVLYDMGGSDIRSAREGTLNGRNFLSLSNLDELNNGLYLLVITIDGKTQQHKVVLQH